MVNLTEMSKAFPRKNLSKIINSSEIQEYVQKLSEITNVSSFDLLQVRKGGNLNNIEQGTWAHQKIALRVAQKLSTEFAIQVDTKIEELLKYGSTSIKPLTQLEIIAQSAQILLEQDKRINTVENKILELEARTTTRPNYFTVAGYGTLNKIPVNNRMAASLGRKATTICKQRNIPVDKIPDPRFGEVGMYPMEILEEVFSLPLN